MYLVKRGGTSKLADTLKEAIVNRDLKSPFENFLNQLIEILKIGKKKQGKYLIDESAWTVIEVFFDTIVNENIFQKNSRSDYTALVSTGLKLVELLDFIEGSCLLQLGNANQSAKVNIYKIPNLPTWYFAIIKGSIYKKPEDLLQAENYLKILHPKISHYKKHPLYAYFQCCYLSYSALIYVRKNDYLQAEKYARHAEYYMHLMIQDKIEGGQALADTYNFLITSCILRKDYLQAMHYAKSIAALEGDLENIFATRLLNYRKNVDFINLRSESELINKVNYHKERKETRFKTIAKLKRELTTFNKHELEINPFLKNLFALPSEHDVANADDHRFVLQFLQKEKMNLDLLRENLTKYEISFLLEREGIILEKCYKLDVKKFALACQSYHQEVNKRLKRKEKSESLPNSALAILADTITPTSLEEVPPSNIEQPSIVAKERKIAADVQPVKQEKIKTRPIEEKSLKVKQEPAHIAKAKVAFFRESKNNNPVFELYGDVAHRQFACADYERLEQQGASKRDLKDLERMLNRGKVLGNSKGNKGFIIKDQKIKGKNCKHNHRFLGQVVEKIVIKEEEKEQQYTLFKINQFSPTHKTK